MARSRTAQLPAISEAEHQDQVLRLARLCGWHHYHTCDSRRSPEGFPDLVLARRPRLLFRELKTESGNVTKAQEFWLNLLRLCGQDAEVWRPSDFDRIVQELR
jgi:VRR-NUC domain-containing protein